MQGARDAASPGANECAPRARPDRGDGTHDGGRVTMSRCTHTHGGTLCFECFRTGMERTVPPRGLGSAGAAVRVARQACRQTVDRAGHRSSPADARVPREHGPTPGISTRLRSGDVRSFGAAGRESGVHSGTPHILALLAPALPPEGSEATSARRDLALPPEGGSHWRTSAPWHFRLKAEATGAPRHSWHSGTLCL